MSSMSGFAYQAGTLHAEGVPLARIAEGVGTPVYIYSATQYGPSVSSGSGAP